MARLDPRLARANKYLAIAESEDSKREAYKLAAEEIAAYKQATGASNRDIGVACKRHHGSIARLLKWRESGYAASTPFLMDEEATKRAARSHAKAILAVPEEAKKIVASLDAEGMKNLATTIVNTPVMAEAMRQAEEEKAHVRTVDVTEPKITLLQRIEGDRIRLKHDAELMAGHWHDGRHDTREEELALVRDSMAQAVIEVEQTITTALRGGVEEEVR